MGDLRLRVNSPAINTGANHLLPADTHDLEPGAHEITLYIGSLTKPATIREILEKFKRCLGGLQGPGVVISSAEVRFALRQICESALPQVVFLSHAEIPATVRVVSLGMIQ